MSDNANVAIKQYIFNIDTNDYQPLKNQFGEDVYIFLYSEFGSISLPSLISYSLNRAKDFWDQEEYIASIIFKDMLAIDIQESTEFGLSNNIQDIESDIIFADIKKQIISIGDNQWSFEDYILLDENFFYNLALIIEDDE